jgi:hypothetical protein
MRDQQLHLPEWHRGVRERVLHGHADLPERHLHAMPVRTGAVRDHLLPAGVDLQPRSLLVSELSVPDLEQTLAALANPDLLGALDLVMLELEKRLLRYARSGHELQEMADEGLVLAVRAAARLAQAQSSAQHTAGHLQVVGVGDWEPRSTQPGWSDDPRVVDKEEAEGET